VLSEIFFSAGSTPNGQALSMTASAVTIFVGPNNSGKSIALSELSHLCQTAQIRTNSRIVSKCLFDVIPLELAELLLERITVPPQPHEKLEKNQRIVLIQQQRRLINDEHALSLSQNPSRDPDWFCAYFVNPFSKILDATSRMQLSSDCRAEDLQQTPKSSLQKLFMDDSTRESLRRTVYDAIGEYLVIDPTRLGNFQVRLSRREPSCPSEERGLHNEAIEFHKQATEISQYSDGIKAYCGIIIEAIAGDPQILFIDEPEAFLHASLATKLGNDLSKIASGNSKRLFIATHSPFFVMGCIQSGVPVNIVRLTYKNQIATARLLPREEIVKLMRNPLLRSLGVLNAIFHDAAVITEGDTDRVFYDEINYRLFSENSSSGIGNCLFLQAQNKQTVKNIVSPLRKFGIPAAAIVDIDTLKEGGAPWMDFLSSGFLTDIDRQGLATIRSQLQSTISGLGEEFKKRGIAAFDEPEAEAVRNLLERLASYGLFVVPVGEVEGWLRKQGVSGHGTVWLEAMLGVMGDDPGASNYMRPEEDDVWQFISAVGRWARNTERRGIPG
jgi:ABC-type cobalamin/Fe3+-siderophores transport system ATPase subunit